MGSNSQFDVCYVPPGSSATPGQCGPNGLPGQFKQPSQQDVATANDFIRRKQFEKQANKDGRAKALSDSLPVLGAWAADLRYIPLGEKNGVWNYRPEFKDGKASMSESDFQNEKWSHFGRGIVGQAFNFYQNAFCDEEGNFRLEKAAMTAGISWGLRAACLAVPGIGWALAGISLVSGLAGLWDGFKRANNKDADPNDRALAMADAGGSFLNSALSFITMGRMATRFRNNGPIKKTPEGEASAGGFMGWLAGSPLKYILPIRTGSAPAAPRSVGERISSAWAAVRSLKKEQVPGLAWGFVSPLNPFSFQNQINLSILGIPSFQEAHSKQILGTDPYAKEWKAELMKRDPVTAQRLANVPHFKHPNGEWIIYDEKGIPMWLPAENGFDPANHQMFPGQQVPGAYTPQMVCGAGAGPNIFASSTGGNGGGFTIPCSANSSPRPPRIF